MVLGTQLPLASLNVTTLDSQFGFVEGFIQLLFEIQTGMSIAEWSIAQASLDLSDI